MSLVEKIVSQTHELPEDFNVCSAQQIARSEREKALQNSVDHIKNTVPRRISRSLLWLEKKQHPFGYQRGR